MRDKAFEKLITKSLSKAKYKNIDPCKRDILSVLKVYKGLAPDYDNFVFDDGNEKTLVNVNGTIPIKYKGSTYNIPVCFWLLTDYPTAAPMAFVKPTQNMQVKASSSVDLNGRVTIPYIEEWQFPDSNLLDLIQICTLVFGQSPPVFSKAKSTLQHQASVVSLPPTSNRQSCQLTRQSSLQESDHRSDSSGSDISEEHVRLSLLSAVEEKIKTRIEEEFMKTKAEIESLHSTNKELLDGQEKIDEILTGLKEKTLEMEEHQKLLGESEASLKLTCKELEKAVEEIQNVDSYVLVPSSLHNQMVDAHVEDTAIEDAIYSLGKALHQGTIECDVYLKKVRNLSRKQFMQRAVIMKCKQKSGLRRLEANEQK